MSVFMHQTGKSLSLGDAAIYYEEAGNPAGMPLLLLHGGFGTLKDFNGLAESLRADYRLIAMDGRGQGKSTLGNEPLTYQQVQEDAEKLLAHLQIEKVIVLGFSDGGMVAHRMAIAHPERVLKLISIAAPWRKEDLELIRESLEKVTPESWRQKFPDSYELYQSLNPAIDFGKLVNALKNMWLDESISGGYPGEQVQRIQCPLLVVRGDEDHLFPRESVVLLSDSVKTATLLNLPFARHEVHKDQPETVARFIVKFLQA